MTLEFDDGIECPSCKGFDTIVQDNRLALGYECKCRTCGKSWFLSYAGVGNNG